MAIFQSVSECLHAEWTTIVKLRPSHSTIFTFWPIFTQKLLDRCSPNFYTIVPILMRVYTRQRCIQFQNAIIWRFYSKINNSRHSAVEKTVNNMYFCWFSSCNAMLAWNMLSSNVCVCGYVSVTCQYFIQEALLWQTDCATRLSV